MENKKSDTRLEIVARKVVLKGIRPIMFDRYAISEWASRGAFQSLNKYLDDDAILIVLREYLAPMRNEVERIGILWEALHGLHLVA